MKHFHYGIPALVVCVLFGILSNCSADSIDQQFVGPDQSPMGENIGEGYQFIAMTYTAGLTGALSGINVDVNSWSQNLLHVAIHEVSEGTPTATILGETVLSTTGAPLSQLITFPNQIAQTAGLQYAIVVDYQTPAGDGLSKGNWGGDLDGNYSGGQSFFSNNCVQWEDYGPDADLHFTTYSTSVPEPSALALRGIGARGLLAYAWRQA